MSETSKKSALPFDWDDWFPAAVAMRLGLKRSYVTAKDVVNYVILRLQDDDNARHIETAQCLALLHYLGGPANDTTVAVVNTSVDRRRRRKSRRMRALATGNHCVRGKLDHGRDVLLVLTQAELEKSLSKARRLLGDP